MRRAAAVLLFLSLLPTAAAHADGGRLRFSRTCGPFLVTLFTTPEPLTPGVVDFSVMVQDAQTGNMLPDARVSMILRQMRSGHTVQATASHAHATNRLLEAAEFSLPEAGEWSLQLDAREGSTAAACDANIRVEAGSRRLPIAIIFATLPVVMIGMFVLHQRQKMRVHRRAVQL